MVAPDYNPSDSTPSSEAQMAVYGDCVSTGPWMGAKCSLRVSAMFGIGPHKYVDTNNHGAGGDARTYDAGQLIVATSGQADTATVGALYVHYECEFWVPQAPVPQIDLTKVTIYETSGEQEVLNGVQIGLNSRAAAL
jgi:hypothetical protein